MASTITEAQAELIRSLAPDDIPIKLRCAICSKLAVNAYRLPCCEQAICESCQSNLPASCPVCEHSPLSAEDCNPNKSLRTTIRVFLRTAEKKREASRPKEDKNSEPATPVEAPKQNLPDTEMSAVETALEHNSGVDAPSNQIDRAENIKSTPAQPANQDISSHDNTPTTKAPGHDEAGDIQNVPAEGSVEEVGVQNPDEQTLTKQDVTGEPNGEDEGDENQQGGDGEDEEDQEKPESESTNGNFPNSSFSGSGDFNQMQMMMAMQNGMAPNSFGSFPMMGMPGMGMDPMTMQNLYMNGGFQGMGMNGMGGFGGGFGQGSNNNWNGSQSWNFDQNNYNQNGPGMGTGDFGGFNSGFQTGYNQGNYGQFNDYRRNNFGRGRGRGRGYYGGYGRGGYQFGGNAHYQDQAQFPQHGSGQNGQNSIDADGQQVDENGQPIQKDGTEGADETRTSNTGQADGSSEATGNEVSGDVSSITPDMGPGTFAVRPVPVPDVPLNAPTGPKAMRQGLPNTSLHHLRARGYQVGSEVPLGKSTPSARDSPAERGRSRSNSLAPSRAGTDAREKDKDQESQREHSKDQSHDHDKHDRERDDHGQNQNHTGSASRTVSRSRSRSRGHKSSRRRRRYRSESVEDDGYDDDSRRKKHRSRRHHHDDEESSRSKDKDKDRDDRYAGRNRSTSPAESKRSSHRSRRDRDSDKRKDREKDKDDHRSDDRKKSGHRSSHRDRDYDRERRRDKDRDRSDKDRKDRKDRHRDRDRRDRDRDREKDRDRESHRDRDRERDSKYSSRHQSTDAGTASNDKDPKPPSGPRNNDTKANSVSRTESSGKDPHTLEREARDRERLLKEAQRIAGMTGWKRNRGDDGGDTGSRKGRRTGSSTSARRSEVINGGDEEERMRRLEAEREGDRWS
ncbi:hypothetical protein FVEN_g7908 [Fusarium venenatum]|uniref:RING-type domain-containing protein n=1 Tax=Fusarium venenatum TaxID=56646 RepID=A0A2L2TRF2_9HYPO|nr:uncharacterized protein FVRRES_08718 [Fusarium venenatum]KAG8354189.1 hypothetical protein FVEN_g7908 [Fusarium venenatum]KAH6965469.1 hypothetical protein EDB82DRAFT_561312 [Fusarium venenatum]CEI68641.1 unnamed protein product [Fusarium venenatum]